MAQEYQIVRSMIGLTDLELKVGAECKAGWRANGSPFSGDSAWCQSMTREGGSVDLTNHLTPEGEIRLKGAGILDHGGPFVSSPQKSGKTPKSK